MIGPSVSPADVGLTGLLWLFLSYGYALYFAANMIGEGSELLLLVPSMAGLVGGVVLPLLGAVPDGAIILFSGLGSIETAQETLSVGVGALAGSTIMLLTIPWALSVYGGRVSIRDGKPGYMKRPKLFKYDTLKATLAKTGVAISDEVSHAGAVMAVTTIPYFLIQVPAFFLHGPSEEVAAGEHWWSLAALIVCICGWIYYMRLQLRFSKEGQDKDRRIAVTKKILHQGKLSLSGALQTTIEEAKKAVKTDGQGYGSIDSDDLGYTYPPPAAASYLKDILIDAFRMYDVDQSGHLEKRELRLFFKDFHENISEADIDKLFSKADVDSDGSVSFDEFIGMTFNLIVSHGDAKSTKEEQVDVDEEVAGGLMRDDEEEQEEIPEDFTSLSPDEQQRAIKSRAFRMLAIGTAIVIYFSDPMVDVMQEIAVRAALPPFYVSFVLAPLASNASEVVASMYYAGKKTRKTISVSLSTLEGAASMNNTFCLSIFMCLIFVRGLAWQYTAETVAIIVVEFIMAYLVQRDVMTTGTALFVMMIFPLSLVLVAMLEHFGFD